MKPPRCHLGGPKKENQWFRNKILRHIKWIQWSNKHIGFPLNSQKNVFRLYYFCEFGGNSIFPSDLKDYWHFMRTMIFLLISNLCEYKMLWYCLSRFDKTDSLLPKYIGILLDKFIKILTSCWKNNIHIGKPEYNHTWRMRLSINTSFVSDTAYVGTR